MISVIMLTYNREAFVGRAIESVLKQTLKNFEFIIVDNGSTDQSGEIAEQYGKKDERIRVIHRQRGNIGAGRNTGLYAARGEYIAFIDDDDWVEPDFLEFLYQLVVEHDADVAICGAADKAFDEKKIMDPEEALITLMWRKKYNVGFPTKLIRKIIFQKTRFNEVSRFDDIYLMPQILADANRVVYHGLPKYHTFRHQENNSAWTTNYSLLTGDIIEEYLNVYRKRTDWLCHRFPSNCATWKYFEWSFMISMVEKVKRLGVVGCEKLVEEMKQKLMENEDVFLNAPEIRSFEKEWFETYVKTCG